MGFITYEESMDNLYNSIKNETKNRERLFLSDSLGRVLAKDIVANFNSPSSPTSAMDGYAIKYKDQKNKKIKILQELPAGSDKGIVIESGNCVKTFTGSLMSEGSDTLIPIENVEVKDGYIIIKEEVKKGFAFREIGENFKKDEVLIKKGTIISYPQIGVMASLNISQVEVFQKPRVAIISTGSEIVDVGENLKNSAQIVSSNHFTLEALAKEARANVLRVGVVGDDKDKIKSQILNALEDSDIVVTTGGVSVGDYDFVKDVINEFEPKYIINGVKIKPGQHIKIVKIGKKYIFALPGFPYSSTITFMLYVLPLIKSLQGLNPQTKTIKAKLKENYRKKTKKDEFVASNLSIESGEFVIDFKEKKAGSSAILTNMLGNIAIMHLNINEGDKKAGDLVDVIPNFKL